MNTEPFLPHAAVRAKERYGLDLSIDDIRALATRCLRGEGLFKTDPDGGQHHTLILNDRVLWAVYRPPGNGRHPLGEVVTVLPAQNAANKCLRFASTQKFRRLNGFVKKHRR